MPLLIFGPPQFCSGSTEWVVALLTLVSFFLLELCIALCSVSTALIDYWHVCHGATAQILQLISARAAQAPSGPAFRSRAAGKFGTTGHNRAQHQNQVQQEGRRH